MNYTFSDKKFYLGSISSSVKMCFFFITRISKIQSELKALQVIPHIESQIPNKGTLHLFSFQSEKVHMVKPFCQDLETHIFKSLNKLISLKKQQ